MSGVSAVIKAFLLGKNCRRGAFEADGSELRLHNYTIAGFRAPDEALLIRIPHPAVRHPMHRAEHLILEVRRINRLLEMIDDVRRLRFDCGYVTLDGAPMVYDEWVEILGPLGVAAVRAKLNAERR